MTEDYNSRINRYLSTNVLYLLPGRPALILGNSTGNLSFANFALGMVISLPSESTFFRALPTFSQPYLVNSASLKLFHLHPNSRKYLVTSAPGSARSRWISLGSVMRTLNSWPGAHFGGGTCSVRARIVVIKSVFAWFVGRYDGNKAPTSLYWKAALRDVSEVVFAGHFSGGGIARLRLGSRDMYVCSSRRSWM